MKEFQAVFQINKLTIFEVKYYTLGSNKKPYFATSAAQFCRSKRDFTTCGQAQKHVLSKHGKAYKFFEKWDQYHLKELTPEQLEELIQDLETLKNQYNYLIDELDPNNRPYNPHFAFYRLVEFSKQEPKKKRI